jgi:Mn2+/Fe2+ NRAMP family transporter
VRILGKHLSELCKAEYPKYVKYCLWLLAEIAVIAADIPEGIISSLLYYFKLILDTYLCPWLLLNAVLIRHVYVSVLFLFVTFRLLKQTG